jgi:hypothetical protein
MAINILIPMARYLCVFYDHLAYQPIQY